MATVARLIHCASPDTGPAFPAPARSVTVDRVDDQRLTPFAPPTTDSDPPKPESLPDFRTRATSGARRAGALLCVNFCIVMLTSLIAPAVAGRPLGVSPLIPGFVDLLIGVLLVRGNASVVNWAIIRAMGGLLVFGGINIMNHQFASLPFLAIVTTSLLVLLFGDPRPLRVNLATGAFGIYALMSVLGLMVLSGSGNPITSAMARAQGGVEREPVRKLTGVAKAYKLTFPEGWYLRTAEAAHKNNALADRWAMKAGLDIHVMTIVETVALRPGTALNLDLFTDKVVEGIEKVGTGRVELSRTPLEGVPSGLVVHSSVQTQSLGEMHYLHGAIVDGADAYQIIAFARSSQWDNVGRELEEIVRSFRLPAR